MTDSAQKFIPSPRSQDCSKHVGGWGIPMTDFEYIWYGNKSEDDYPDDACEPYYHKKAQINAIQVNDTLAGSGDSGKGSLTINANTINANNFSSESKFFDIPHPTKKNKRLLHGCLEGPELGVYVRGRLTNETVIELPDYWMGLVDPETITVTLTQIGSSQDLIVEKIEWGRKVKIKSGSGSNIDCFYTVYAMRKDVPVLEVEQDVDAAP